MKEATNHHHNSEAYCFVSFPSWKQIFDKTQDEEELQAVLMSSSSSSTKIASPVAIGITTEEPPTKCHPRYPSLLKNSNCNNKKKNKNKDIEIEVEWKETNNRHVRFDPDLDWKTESSKAEQGHLRRLAEKEIRRRLDAQKGKKPRDHPELQSELLLTRSDRLKETFMYICFCEVDLLLEQYENHKSNSVLLNRMFDRLFEEAGIKPPCERTCGLPYEEDTSDLSSSSSWLWTCFLALQLEYRRQYDTNSQISSRTTFFFPHQPFVSGLGRKTDEALFFVHWLSPVFRYENKESKQRLVYDSILGDEKAMAKFEEYLFCEQNKDNERVKDLRMQVHGFFNSMLYSSLVTSPDDTTDLSTFFLAIREADAGSVMYPSFSCCEDRPRRSMFPYHALTCESKHRLFLISAMPAYRAYLVAPPVPEGKQEQQQIVVASSPRGPSMESPTCCTELLRFGFSGKSKIPRVKSGDVVLEEQDPRSSLVVTDTTSTDVHHCEYEFSNELCNLLFESA